MRIGVDAMGCDHAPAPEVQGALDARDFLEPDDRIVLVGREDLIREHLSGCDDWSEKIDIQHAEQTIGMDESPVEALRSKPNSSIGVLAKMHKAGQLDAIISAGNTGAYVAASQMLLRRLKGVQRPGIAIITPTANGPVAVCDVGANVNCRPIHLLQYGVMASVHLSAIHGVKNPRVGLLSVGAEDAKGNDLVKRTNQLLRDDPNVNFIGNVEGRDLFAGTCDVMVCEGFVGNVILKLIEGMVEGIMRAMTEELASVLPDSSKGMLRQAVEPIMKKYDYNEYGGAPLLGVGGICIICHGASSARGIYNAIRAAKECSQEHVNEQITQLLSRG